MPSGSTATNCLVEKCEDDSQAPLDYSFISNSQHDAICILGV